MSQTRFFTFVSSVLILISLSLGQDKTETEKKERTFSKPPKLELAFEDNFETDTRGDYETEKDVTWEKGKLVLGKGSTLLRDFDNAGPWVAMEFDLKFPELTEDGQESEIKIWLDLEGATDSFVWFRQKRANGKTRSAIFIADSKGNWDEDPEIEPVKKPFILDGNFPSGKWSIGYRNGLWSVGVNGKTVVAAYIENGHAFANGFLMNNRSASGEIERLSIDHSVQTTRPLSEEDESKLEEAKALNQQLIQHYQNGEFVKGAELALKVFEIQKELNGIHHPEYIQSLNSLAALYVKMGAHKKAEPLMIESMRIQGDVVGTEHPSYANSLNRLAILYKSVGAYEKAEPLYVESIKILENVLGNEHPDYATCLGNLAVLFKSMGAYAKAEPLYVESMRIQEDVLGKEHPDYATSLANLAELFRVTGAYDKAEPLFVESLRIREKVLGKEHPSYGTSLNNLALLYLKMGAYEKAELRLHEALRIRENVLGKEHPMYAVSLNNLAALFQETGAYDKAEPLFVESLRIQEKILGKEHPDYAQGLSNLAVLYLKMSAYEKAEPLYVASLRIQENVLGKEHPHYAQSLNNLADLYLKLGAYEKAEPLNLEAMRIRGKVLGKEHPHYAQSLNNLAGLYRELGAYEKAEPLNLEAMRIRGKVLGKEHPLYAVSLNNLAVLYESMAAYEKAEPLYVESKRICRNVLGKEHPDYATSLNNLAELYRKMGAYDKAEPLYVESKRICRNVLGKEHPLYASSLDNLAVLYESMAAYEKAEPLIVEAMRIREKVLGKEHPLYAQSLSNLALLYFSTGDQEKGERLLLESMRIWRNVLGKQHPLYAQSLNNLAVKYRELGAQEKAEPLAHTAIQIVRANFERYSAIQTESRQMEYQNSFRDQLNGYLSVVQKTKSNAIQAFELVTNWKGQIQQRQSTYRTISGDQDLGKLFLNFRIASQKLFKHLDNDPNENGWQSRLKSLTDEKEAIEKELAAKSSKFAQTKERITAKQIQKSLPLDAAFVNFHQYSHEEFVDNKWGSENRLLAFVASKNGPVQMIQLGEIESINKAIDRFRQQFLVDEVGIPVKIDPKRLKDSAAMLRKRIWEPIETKLGGAKTVFISPDGQLGSLPFAALPGSDHEKYLIEDFDILMIPVPQLLPRFKKNRESSSRPNGDLLLLGNVMYDKAATETIKPKKKRRRGTDQVLRSTAATWDQLDATAGEIAFIQKLFFDEFDAEYDAVKTLEESNATEARFFKYAPQYECLHIATHGFFAPPEVQSHDSVKVDPNARHQFDFGKRKFRSAAAFKDTFHPGLLSGLVFAGVNDKNKAADADDGIMTADEISGLPLSGVDLVTLSACETGLGKTAGGEGLIGIQRAFQISGARSVVASLWQVDDVATRKLMERFYKNMFKDDMNKLEAIMEAQRYILNNPESIRGKRKLTADPNDLERKPKRTHPRYWAAWVLSGDWR